MRGISRLALALSFAILVSALSAQQLVPPDPKQQAVEKYRAKLLAGPFFYAKLTEVKEDGEMKGFKVEAPYQHRTLNAENWKTYLAVRAQYQAAYIRGDRGEVERLYGEAYNAYVASFDVEDAPIAFELKAGAELKVRKSTLPPKEPGDDGILRPYTAKELATLKGDPRLPGYAANFKDLDADTYVAVYLDKVKMKPAPKTAKDKEKEAETEMEVVYPVNILMILPPPGETPMGAPGGNPFAGKNPFVK